MISSTFEQSKYVWGDIASMAARNLSDVTSEEFREMCKGIDAPDCSENSGQGKIRLHLQDMTEPSIFSGMRTRD